MRHHADRTAAGVQSKLVSAGTCFAVGAWAKSRRTNPAATTEEQRALPTIAGLPPLALYGIVGLGAGALIGGRVGEVLGDAGTGLIDAYAYAWGNQ
jgi:hypothetical protein